MTIDELYEARGQAESRAKAYEEEALNEVARFRRALDTTSPPSVAQVYATLAMACEIRASRMDAQIEEAVSAQSRLAQT